MKKWVHQASARGRSVYDWLDSWHQFSFANYYNPDKIHFGALRVLNDDLIHGGGGFGKHPHDNMEIITIPIYGALKHADSMGHTQTISENEVQVMSAGSGIFHSEFNAGETDTANFLQIWIFPNKKNVKPVYNQKYFKAAEAVNHWQFLVSDVENPLEDSLTIHQNASIARAFMHEGTELSYKIQPKSFGVFLFLISGEIEVEGVKLNPRDAIGLCDGQEFNIKALTNSYILNIEIPEISN